MSHPLLHVNMLSGGRASWFAGKRVAARHGAENLVNLFADTLIEDEDLYRFRDEAAADIGGRLVVIADGRTPWDVFRDERFLGNNRITPCSKILKQQLCRKWVDGNCSPGQTTLYVGISWNEMDRVPDIRERWLPWPVEFPCVRTPPLEAMGEAAWKERLAAAGLTMPRLYGYGFPHNNCGGFCVRAGQAHFKLLLETMPERYAFHERKEQELREYLGKDVAILRDRRGGETTPLTLRAFREKLQAGKQCDLFDWGGCGCFTTGND